MPISYHGTVGFISRAHSDTSREYDRLTIFLEELSAVTETVSPDAAGSSTREAVLSSSIEFYRCTFQCLRLSHQYLGELCFRASEGKPCWPMSGQQR
jgi:hypothetical protein